MHGFHLPSEIVLSIAEHFDRARDISSLARANRRLHDILLPWLYKFNVREQNSSALHWYAEDAGDRASRLAARLLHEYKADVNTIYEGNTPLISAAIHGLESVTEILLRTPGISVNFRNKKGQTALWHAASQGHVAIVEQLLARKDTQIDCSDEVYGQTPLAAGALNGHRDIIKCLLRTGRVDINKGDLHNMTPIFHALRSKDEGITNTLLSEKTINLACRDRRRRTPLNYAASLGELCMVKMLLDAGADVDVTDEQEEMPLHKAIASGHLAMVEVLLEALIRTWPPPGFERSPEAAESLCFAAARGQTEAVQLLIGRKFDVNAGNRHNRAPIHIAASYGHTRVMAVLLDQKKIDINALDSLGQTALHLAAKKGHLDVLIQLLDMPGIEVDRRDNSGATPFWLAVQRGHEELAMSLLPLSDLNVNGIIGHSLPVQDDSTPLHLAVRGQNVPLVRELVQRSDVSLNVVSNDRTPLTWAVDTGDITIVDLLLTRADIRINPEGIHEVPTLWLAIEKGDIAVVRRLVRNPKVNLNHGCGIYEAPLPHAIKKGDRDIIKLLLAQEKRLHINKKHNGTATALLLAVHKGDDSIVELILRHTRVDPNSADDGGRIALEWQRLKDTAR
jgi:ankyrin repeat protein